MFGYAGIFIFPHCVGLCSKKQVCGSECLGLPDEFLQMPKSEVCKLSWKLHSGQLYVIAFYFLVTGFCAAQ